MSAQSPLKTVLFCLVCLLVSIGFSKVAAGEPLPQHSAEGENFAIRCYDDGPTAANVLKLCHSLRAELFRAWGPDQAPAAWQPRCEIVLHPSLQSYLNVVGPDASQTWGSSLIEKEGKQIISRRIDLRVDERGELPALAHELTHVVLADRFADRQPPHWLDEGIAMLADTRSKQSLHERDCRHALQQGRPLLLNTLLNLEGFSSADQMPAFYGQSLSLVQFLCRRGSTSKLLQFAADGLQHGYDQALRQHYQINGVSELQTQWKNFAYAEHDNQFSATIVAVSFRP